MIAILERRVSRAAAWSRRIALFSFVLFVLCVLGHRLRLMDVPELLVLLGLDLVLAVFGVMLAGLGFRRFWKYGDRGGGNLVVAALFSLLVLVPYAVYGFRIFLYPALNDVSTDLDDPPAFVDTGTAEDIQGRPSRPIAPEQATVQREAYPGVIGRRYGASIDHVLNIVDRVVKSERWQIISHPVLGEDQDRYEMQVVARTALFRFPSDIVIRLSDEGDSTFVDMRSASRYGRTDFGTNAAFIRDFLSRLDAEMATETGR
jgi:uncharacterized protein (DUF1499 family)